MKTTLYNPSALETEIAHAIVSLQKEIEKQLNDKQISQVTADLLQDNPSVKFHIVDHDGDHHKVIVKIVQIPDEH